MDINEGTTTDDLWTPYKELAAVVEGYLSTEGGSTPYAVHTFESVLRRHKQTFLSLFKNPAKNAAHREELKKGITEGINLPSVGRIILSKELVDEAIIISDMVNANELSCVELLHTAQRQAARRAGPARGLLAVMLYHDGRRALVHALRDLLTARDGVSWSVTGREEIVSYVSRYVEQLVADGVLGGALDALRRCSLAAELELLRRNRALPPRQHCARLVACICSTRKLLAGVVFAASAQRGLDRDIFLRLLNEQITSPTKGPTGALDEISMALQMALLYALDLSVLHRREDGEELAKKLPLIQDPDLISVLLDELSPPAQPNQTQEGQDKNASGLKALCQLSLGLALAALKRAPQSLLRRGNEAKVELLDQDEVLVDAAIDGEVFEYLEEAILSSDIVSSEEYYQRRIHSLITDFIVLMHSKLMEMRVKAEEAGRTAQMYAAEGLAAGGAPRSRLAALLRCVERLYARDPRGLRHDYWLACDASAHTYRAGGRAATLYKFVRLSGEVVVASLLAAYLRALAALAVPTHTWALLARRDALSAHHLLHALHLYHRNLRVDSAPFAEHLHASSLGATAIVTPAARPGRLLVRQEEVEAMIAALKLIAAVARQDEAASISICENPQWDAINCMFGLICCHVPLQLKAQLCATLGALGGCAGNAPRVWAALDAAQLVCGDKDKRALSAELLEVECRIEEYPLSRAFLGLLDSLCAAAPLPRALGAGTRPPGLDPYVDHVLNKLALPAPHRPYTKPHEKWQMLSLCFRLFARWLEQYEPAASDFPPPHREPDVCPPPGFRLLMQLHARSELLRLVLAAMDDALLLLLDRHDVPEQCYVEETLISSLQLVERALVLERSLSSAAAEAGRAVLVVGLSKLILAPEGPAGTDRVVSCCRGVQLGGALAAAARAALAALAAALRWPAAARHLVTELAHRHALAAEIRSGFVECLEAEEWAAEGENAEAAKLGVVSLLLQLLPSAPPNFAHFLLGYQLHDDISRSALHEAGAAGSPRTCLHAILDILDAHIAPNGPPDKEASEVVEKCYRVVYMLCARPQTSAPALRLLRARDYFLARHVKHTIDLEKASVRTLSARSWLLRACACEAGAAGAARLHAALAALLAALLHAPPAASQEWEWCVIRACVEALPLRVAEAREPRWELFHAHQLRAAIAECDLPTGAGGKRISVPRVHAVLARELAALRASAPQRALVAHEIQKVLDYVTEVNRQRNLAATLTHYYDSWRQLTEILFCVAPEDLLNLESRKNLLLSILQDLLNKIPPAEVLPQIGNLASGTVLLLLVNLRHCYILQKRESNLKSSEFETTFFGPSTQIMQTKSLTLKFILQKIISWILVSSGSTQKMRVNLYGALLNFLNIVNLKPSPADPEEEINSTYVSRLDSSKARPSKEESTLKSMVIDVINNFGDKLCAIVCSDCISAGHDVCRMVALSCLDTFIEINPGTDWMDMLTNQGYLRSLIDSLLQDDEGLKEALEPSPRSLRVLYVYESKMSLLLKLAGSRAGAESVLAQGALGCLAGLRALHCHPDVHAPPAPPPARARPSPPDFVPSVATRFRQMVVPALALCDALLSSLGAHNHSCVLHVAHFLLSHLECVDVVLRAAHPNSPQGLLIELEALTSVIARASNPEVLSALGGDAALRAGAAQLQRIQALMLALLPRFQRPPEPEPEADAILYYKIVCNLLLYARNTLDAGGADGGGGGGGWAAEGARAAGGAALQLAAALLRRRAAHDKLLATTQHQLHAVPSMTLEDMKKQLGAGAAGASPLEARAAVQAQLRARGRARADALARCEHALHAALHLAWAHARARLRAALPPLHPHHPHDGLNKSNALNGALGEELPELRKELIAVFNDRFTEELLETTKNQPAMHRSFLEVLLKDIKIMIQFSPY